VGIRIHHNFGTVMPFKVGATIPLLWARGGRPDLPSKKPPNFKNSDPLICLDLLNQHSPQATIRYVPANANNIGFTSTAVLLSKKQGQTRINCCKVSY
jgi:hypothetical protein